MKRIFIILLIFVPVIFFSCKTNLDKKDQPSSDAIQHMADSANYANIQWIDTLVDLGNIRMGEKRNLSFRFQNAGNKPLYLYSVEPTCGCTITNYTKNAVMPGQQGTVTAVFNSSNHPGEFRKGIRVKANTKNIAVSLLIFSGTVVDTTK